MTVAKVELVILTHMQPAIVMKSKLKMSIFEINYSVHGYHFYQPLWTVTIGDLYTRQTDMKKQLYCR